MKLKIKFLMSSSYSFTSIDYLTSLYCMSHNLKYVKSSFLNCFKIKVFNKFLLQFTNIDRFTSIMSFMSNHHF